MVDRHVFGDLALAVLLAFPLAWVALPQGAATHPQTQSISSASSSSARAPEGRIGLFG